MTGPDWTLKLVLSKDVCKELVCEGAWEKEGKSRPLTPNHLKELRRSKKRLCSMLILLLLAKYQPFRKPNPFSKKIKPDPTLPPEKQPFAFHVPIQRKTWIDSLWQAHENEDFSGWMTRAFAVEENVTFWFAAESGSGHNPKGTMPATIIYRPAVLPANAIDIKIQAPGSKTVEPLEGRNLLWHARDLEAAHFIERAIELEYPFEFSRRSSQRRRHARPKSRRTNESKNSPLSSPDEQKLFSDYNRAFVGAKKSKDKEESFASINPQANPNQLFSLLEMEVTSYRRHCSVLYALLLRSSQTPQPLRFWKTYELQPAQIRVVASASQLLIRGFYERHLLFCRKVAGYHLWGDLLIGHIHSPHYPRETDAIYVNARELLNEIARSHGDSDESEGYSSWGSEWKDSDLKSAVPQNENWLWEWPSSVYEHLCPYWVEQLIFVDYLKEVVLPLYFPANRVNECDEGANVKADRVVQDLFLVERETDRKATTLATKLTDIDKFSDAMCAVRSILVRQTIFVEKVHRLITLCS